MESIKSATPLIGKNYFLCTIDLKDAYYHVPICQDHQKYLRFTVRSPGGKILHFQFKALPFGISSAPRIFTKIMAEVVAHLRLKGIIIVPYLDDLLLVAKTKSDLKTHLQLVIGLLQDLGWVINRKKIRFKTRDGEKISRGKTRFREAEFFPTVRKDPKNKGKHKSLPEERVVQHSSSSESSGPSDVLYPVRVLGSKPHKDYAGLDYPGVGQKPSTSRPQGSTVSSGRATSKAYGLDPERAYLMTKGLSTGVIDTIQASRKPVTNAIYAKIWKKFCTWCGDYPPSPENPNLGQILDFLQAGFSLGLKPSTLKVQISALSIYFDLPLADHRWIRRFIKGCSRIKPRIHNPVPSWDLSLVLNILTEPPFEPLDSANIKILTFKTIFLIAITTARRLGEIQALSRREPFLNILDDKIILKLDPLFLPKVVSEFHRKQEIILPSFCANPKSERERKWQTLDVRRCVLFYLEATKEWCKDSSLLVNFGGKNRGLKASKATLARWIKSTISLCYKTTNTSLPGDIKAHSTRAMATSWAEKRGASLDQICRAATWSSSSTFAKHYRLDIASQEDLAFGRKILQAVVPPK
ncbi:hypothetical protein GDO81_010859 [Engystomops pustulosus]|uniref:ribonuclease H n=1 Tax=Engystomops pustulosus TaxID=76066 RepID=A0AAV7C347_ENGPU|nr:hypothetical protein GDO81_010859 [Engystomops pustulosus]